MIRYAQPPRWMRMRFQTMRRVPTRTDAFFSAITARGSFVIFCLERSSVLRTSTARDFVLAPDIATRRVAGVV